MKAKIVNASAIARCPTHRLDAEHYIDLEEGEVCDCRLGGLNRPMHRLVLAAMAQAADIMDAVDPDDRSATDDELVSAVKALMRLAYDDPRLVDLFGQAVPSWRPDQRRVMTIGEGPFDRMEGAG